MVAALGMLLIVGSFILNFVDGQRSSMANNLGYSGDALRVVATTDTQTLAFVGEQQLTTAVISFAAERQMSVAYSPSNTADVLTLLDVDGRFAFGRPGLVPGDGRAVALVSTQVAGTSRPAVVPDGTTVIGSFTPSVVFDSFYPAVLLDVDAAPLAAGTFLFAGTSANEPEPIIELFARNGMQVQNATVYEVLTLRSALTGPYGIFVLVLAGVSAVAALLTVQIHVSLGRRRLIVAAVHGATRWELCLLVVRRAAPQVLAGTILGTVVCLVGVLAARDLLLAATPVVALALLVATAICGGAWAVIIACVSASEMRRCCRAVPC